MKQTTSNGRHRSPKRYRIALATGYREPPRGPGLGLPLVEISMPSETHLVSLSVSYTDDAMKHLPPI